MQKQSQQPLLPVYLLLGDDEQKKDALEARMRKRFMELGDPALNTETFSVEEHDIEGIINACLTLPFACERRLVIVKDVDALKGDELGRLADYLKNPCETSVLFLTAKKLAKNTRLYKSIEAVSKVCVVSCDAPKAYEFKTYVLQVAKTKGLTFAPGAAEKFLENVGNDTVAINTELDKIAAENQGQRPISVEEVHALVACSADVKPWFLVDAFANRDLAKVLTLLPQVKKSTPIAILMMCVARSRELICARSCLRSAGARDVSKTIATELGFSPALSWRVKNHATWAKKWSDEKLRISIVTSLEAEENMKSGEDQLAALQSWFLTVLV